MAEIGPQDFGMFPHQRFDVTVRREVNVSALAWPGRGEAGRDSGLGCNRAYRDLRRRTWEDAQTVFDLECELIANIEAVYRTLDDGALETQLLESELFLDGLDLGVAATVASLSAAGCIPFSSCNAGAFGGDHQEQYPLVAFYVRPAAIELLLSAAEKAEIGLVSAHHVVVAYADDIRKFSRFARLLIELSRRFKSLHKKPPRLAVKKPTNKRAQGRLPFE
jgi:hypothetical protein